MTSGKSKWPLAILIVLALLGSAFVGYVIWRAVSGMDISGSWHRTPHGSRAERTEEVPPSEDAPDPAAAALAIAEKEWEELYSGIDEEGVQLFTNDQEIISHCLSFRENAESDDPQISLYEVSFRKNAEIMEYADYYSPLQLYALSVQNIVNTYGTHIMAAVSVIRNLNADNSYPWAWDVPDSTLYVAEVTVDGEPRAFIGVFFNEYHAVETAAIPLPFVLPDDYTTFADYAKEAGMKAESVDTDSLKTKGVLSQLVPFGGSSQTAEEMAVELAHMVAERADKSVLAAFQVPEDIIAYCSRFEVCSDEPDRVIRWDMSGPSEGLIKELAGDEDVTDKQLEQFRRMLTTQQAQFLSARVGTAAVAAGAQLTTGLSMSGLEEDALLWLCYGDDDDLCVLVVSVTRNGNGCFDLNVAPLYDVNLVMELLDGADGDELSLDDLVNALMGN